MPRNLSAAAKSFWAEAIRLLKERDTLTKGDGPALQAYSECAARRQAAQGLLERDGLVLGGKPHPALAILQDCEKLIRAYLRDFGLVGLTRERVLPTIEKEETEGGSRALALLMKGTKKRAAKQLHTN